MKRFLISILAFFYLSTSMGATIHLHYCMGKMVSWSLAGTETEKCTFCGMQKTGSSTDPAFSKKGCCQDEHKQIKSSGDQKLVISEFQVRKVSAVETLTPIPDFIVSVAFSEALSLPHAHAPPQPVGPSIFLLNSNFRI